METLLDHHLAAFDRWLQACFMSLTGSSQPHDYLAVVTLLDQLNLKQVDWHQISVILQRRLSFDILDKLLFLFGEMGFDIEFIRIASKFLMDRDRAGSLWVDSHKYAGLATYISEILGDK